MTTTVRTVMMPVAPGTLIGQPCSNLMPSQPDQEAGADSQPSSETVQVVTVSAAILPIHEENKVPMPGPPGVLLQLPPKGAAANLGAPAQDIYDSLAESSDPPRPDSESQSGTVAHGNKPASDSESVVAPMTPVNTELQKLELQQRYGTLEQIPDSTDTVPQEEKADSSGPVSQPKATESECPNNLSQQLDAQAASSVGPVVAPAPETQSVEMTKPTAASDSSGAAAPVPPAVARASPPDPAQSVKSSSKSAYKQWELLQRLQSSQSKACCLASPEAPGLRPKISAAAAPTSGTSYPFKASTPGHPVNDMLPAQSVWYSSFQTQSQTGPGPGASGVFPWRQWHVSNVPPPPQIAQPWSQAASPPQFPLRGPGMPISTLPPGPPEPPKVPPPRPAAGGQLPYKWLPNPNDPAQLKIREQKDKNNARETERKKRKAALVDSQGHLQGCTSKSPSAATLSMESAPVPGPDPPPPSNLQFQ